MPKCCPPSRFRRSAMALAVCAACLPVLAQTEKPEAEPEEVRIEQSSVSAGIGMANGSSDDRALWGQYNGMRTRDTVGILGFDYRLRDDANSSWLQIQGSNLLEETRELSLVWRNPGMWKFTANYGELVRYDPNTINTGLIGAGSTSPQVVLLPGGPGSGSDLELKTKRAALGLGLSTWLTPSMQLQFDVKSENKDGSRLFGVGMNCPTSAMPPGCLGTTGINTGWAVLMLPEPINANHSQVEARLSYAGEQLRVSLGYYGSFYRNNNATLNPVVPAVLNNPLGTPLPLNTGLQALLSQPVALPPDNQAHQIDVSGSFDFTSTTRATFKLGFATAIQDENFASDGLAGAPAGSPSLGGEYTSSLGQIGITSRPIPQLTLLADYRFEDRSDNTPIALYNTEGTATYTNRALPYQVQRGKLEASWQFSSDYRGTLGVDFENIDRGVFTPTSAVSGISALRQKTDENTLRAELRRRMSEDFSGAIRLSSSRRDGSNWLKDNSGYGVTEVTDPTTAFLPTAIFMPTLADRRRDKVKLFADWQPSETLSLQFSAEQGKDSFTAPSTYALQKTRMSFFSLDAGYALSDSWALTAYGSYGQQTFNQSRPAGYVMAFENTSIGAGVGITGKPNSKLELGGSLSYVDENSVYAQTLDSFAGADSAALLAATGGLPDVLFRQGVLKLFGTYSLEKQSSVRLDLNYYRSKTNDWAWGYNGVPFTYSDNTTVRQQQTQNVFFIGIAYNYQFR